MKDYVNGESLFKEEINNFMMFTSSGDPVSFEKTVTSSKWRKAMNLEIKAIEKNGT
jgi:hypothetical protein